MPKSILIALAFLLLAAGISFAQVQGTESLLIGPGDLVHVQVLDTPELEQQSRVGDAGTIDLIIGGDVKIAGLTPAASARAIETVLRDKNLLLRPRVLVTVVDYATQKVSVIGEVKAPGAYPIGTTRSVLQVLALAGGISELADRKILVQRAGSMQKVPYFISNEADTAADTAVQVNPGDTIIVPRAALTYALGDLKLPGGYTMTNNDGKLTVLELVARAGGTNRTASEAHAKLIRKTAAGYVEMPLPLKDIQNGKKPDFALQPNDIVYVPFSYRKNLVLNTSGVVASAASSAVYRF